MVYKGIWLTTTPVALKELTSDIQQDFLKEVSILLALRHPNCLRTFGIFEKGNILYIVSEFAAKGSLLTLLQENGDKYTQSQLIKMGIDVSIAMNYLGSQKIIHRDLSARNLLVDEHNSIKVADFGLSRHTTDNQYIAKSNFFPIRWTAPEAGFYGKYSTKSDVWSFGIVLYEIITKGKIPYESFTKEEVLKQIEKGYRIPCPDECPESLYIIMAKCWSKNPNERPSFLEIKNDLESANI